MWMALCAPCWRSKLALKPLARRDHVHKSSAARASAAMLPCVRQYAAPHARWRFGDRGGDGSLQQLVSSSPLCAGARHRRLCHAAIAAQLGLSLGPYGEADRRAFLRRFDSPAVRRSGVRPTPWLSIGRRLVDPPWPLPSWVWPNVPPAFSSASAGSFDAGPAFFYANEYVDLAVFAHFFMRPLVRGGTYVEIGGSNGVHASNTLFFEQHLNWSGVLIEPTPCGRCVLPHTRPRDLTINAAACRRPANLSGGFMARPFCAPPQDACVARAAGGYGRYTVPCLPMRALLPRALTRVDFFSIDVEEHVMAVRHRRARNHRHPRPAPARHHTRTPLSVRPSHPHAMQPTPPGGFHPPRSARAAAHRCSRRSRGLITLIACILALMACLLPQVLETIPWSRVAIDVRRPERHARTHARGAQILAARALRARVHAAPRRRTVHERRTGAPRRVQGRGAARRVHALPAAARFPHVRVGLRGRRTRGARGVPAPGQLKQRGIIARLRPHDMAPAPAGPRPGRRRCQRVSHFNTVLYSCSTKVRRTSVVE